MELRQAQRFYETLAMLIGKREGVEINVTVTPRKEGQHGEQSRKICNSVSECKQVRVS